MEKIFYIEIRLKKTLFDAFGNDIKKSINEMGIMDISNVHVAEIYLLQGFFSKKDVEKIAKNLFLDSVTQTLKTYIKLKPVINIHKKTVVEVWYKKEVTDPVSLTALKGIRDMGFNRDISVKCGKKYELEGNLTKNQIEIICKKLLANTLIQEYTIF